jgi:hypothetical protein
MAIVPQSPTLTLKLPRLTLIPMTNKRDKIEETGGELKKVPNEAYEKLFAKFAEIETLPVEQWKPAHLLGYFCKRYQDTFGVSYSFKFNHPTPSKSYEVFRINSLAAKLSAKPQILKDYIDWIFQEKVVKGKRRFTSIAFITDDEKLNYYKMNVLLAKRSSTFGRSTPLPEQYRDIIDRLVEEGAISTYGDLAFYDQAYDGEEWWSKLMTELQAIGFDPSILETIV